MTHRPARSDDSARSGPGADWTRDPIQRARYLDGECTPEEKAARDRDVAADVGARARLEREAEFLAAVRRASSAAVPEVPERLEGRVRRALDADRAAGFPSSGPEQGGGGDVVSLEARRRYAKRSLVLAGLAVAAAVAFWVGRKDVQPTDASAVLAARTLRDALNGTVAAGGQAGATCEQGTASPYRFPLVANRELQLQRCVQDDGKDHTVSVLGSGGDAKTPRGFVSVTSAPSGNAPVIGVTKFDDAIVFDVSIGGAKYYLAAPRAFVEKAGGDCAACHGTSREGKANPHVFALRDR